MREVDKHTPLGFGRYKGVSISEMTEGAQIHYLEWMLGQPNLEAQWGDIIRDHLEREKMELKPLTGVEPIHIPKELAERFSIEYFDQWFEHYKDAMNSGKRPKGIITFIESRIYGVWERLRNDLKRPGAIAETGDGHGIIWKIQNTGVDIKVLEMSDVMEDVDCEVEEDDVAF